MQLPDPVHPSTVLWNFSSDIEEITIGHWQLKPMDKSSDQIILHRVTTLTGVPNAFNLPTYLVGGPLVSGAQANTYMLGFYRNQLLNILRLFKEGRVFVGEMWWTEPSGYTWYLWQDLPITTLPKDSVYPLYEMNEEEIIRIQGLALLIEKADVAHKWLKVALTRFHETYTRSKIEDAYLDLCIALESLFNDGGDSITYKVSMRCAHLVNTHPSFLEKLDKETIFKRVKSAYAVRSNIAHGGGYHPKATDTSYSQLWDITRRSLLATMEILAKDSQSSEKDVATYVDNNILLK